MTDETIHDVLRALIRADLETIEAYEQALAHLEGSGSGVRYQLTQFKQEHERRAEQLSDAIVKLGGSPPEGALRQCVIGPAFGGALGSHSGTECALRAILRNEVAASEEHDHALLGVLPASVGILVRLHRESDRRHAEYLERAIVRQVWKQPNLEEETSASA